jgi:hypothetical protein
MTRGGAHPVAERRITAPWVLSPSAVTMRLCLALFSGQHSQKVHDMHGHVAGGDLSVVQPPVLLTARPWFLRFARSAHTRCGSVQIDQGVDGRIVDCVVTPTSPLCNGTPGQ